MVFYIILALVIGAAIGYFASAEVHYKAGFENGKLVLAGKGKKVAAKKSPKTLKPSKKAAKVAPKKGRGRSRKS